MDEQNQTQFQKSKKLVDETLLNATIDENVQQIINKPQADPTGVDEKDKKFMEKVMKLINNGTIDLYKPETLMNKEVYDNLDEMAKGKADTNAVPLLADLRQMKKLYESGHQDSFQIQNLVHRVRLTKERLEKDCGDVYII
jgi:hypothetical protein